MRFLLALLFLVCSLSTAKAENIPLASLPAVKEAEAYLNGIKTLKARFLQTSSGGQRVAGDFYLKRPGKMRFQYDPPLTDFIVADGVFIYYYDGQLKQQSSALISKSLADFFLRKQLTLTGDLRVSGVRRRGGLLHITLSQVKDPLGGTLTLIFSEKPMQLKKWTIIDPEGALTEVDLFEVETGITLDSELFKYYDPSRKKSRYN